MSTTFHVPRNNVATTVAAPRAVGAPITVADSSGFGDSFPLIATAVRGGAVLCILEVTGRTGNTLTVSGAIEGTTDAALLAGDKIEMRPTALALTEVQAAVNALETTSVSTAGSYADPAWIASLAGSKVTGDIAGNAGSITGSIVTAQVAGLDAALAARPLGSAVVLLGADQTITGANTFTTHTLFDSIGVGGSSGGKFNVDDPTDGVTHITGRFSSDTSGAGSYVQYTDGASWNLAAGGAAGVFEVWSGRFPNTLGTLTLRVSASGIVTSDAAGNLAAGAGTLAITATDGFLYVPTAPGTPTGVPTAKTGFTPIVVDAAGSKLWAYVGGGWKSTPLA